MDGAFDWGDETRPEHTNDIVIYELHVKGFTQSATSGVPDEKRGNRGQIDPHLAIARAKIEDAETFDEALDYLTPRETFAVLNSPATLKAVYAMPRSKA